MMLHYTFLFEKQGSGEDVFMQIVLWSRDEAIEHGLLTDYLCHRWPHFCYGSGKAEILR